jgi:hypothetical protein
MGKKILILFLILSSHCFSQKLKCCNSKEEVEKELEGYWIIKESDLNLVYNFHFYAEIGEIYELEKKDIEIGRIPIKTHAPILKIIKSTFGYKINYTTMAGSWKSKIKYLYSGKLILKTNGKLVEYERFEK